MFLGSIIKVQKQLCPPYTCQTVAKHKCIKGERKKQAQFQLPWVKINSPSTLTFIYMQVATKWVCCMMILHIQPTQWTKVKPRTAQGRTTSSFQECR